jgi:hypothetical protein
VKRSPIGFALMLSSRKNVEHLKYPHVCEVEQASDFDQLAGVG